LNMWAFIHLKETPVTHDTARARADGFPDYVLRVMLKHLFFQYKAILGIFFSLVVPHCVSERCVDRGFGLLHQSTIDM
jgi:hypothetical protein